jgi:hypothetical protein
MSRGPGRIQRAIEFAFKANPASTFAVDDLTTLAYPGINRIEKKHRVAVLRAAASASETCGWWYARAERPGHQVIYGNPVDLRSYATWKMRLDFSTGGLSLEEMTAALDYPAAGWSQEWRRIQPPDGAWWKHVEINKARANGKHAEADVMLDNLNASVAVKMKAIADEMKARRPSNQTGYHPT